MDHNAYITQHDMNKRAARVLQMMSLNGLWNASVVEREPLEATVRRYQTINDITYPTVVAGNDDARALYARKVAKFSDNSSDTFHVVKKDTGLAKIVRMSDYAYMPNITFVNKHKEFKSNVGIMFNAVNLPVQPEASNNNTVPHMSVAEQKSNENASKLISTLYGDNVSKEQEDAAENAVVSMTSSPVTKLYGDNGVNEDKRSATVSLAPVSKKTGVVIKFPFKEHKPAI